MGILSHLHNACTLVNRTKGAGKFEETLSVRYDGEDLPLRPGVNHGIPRVAVAFALVQNKLMGSQHPNDPTRFVCKIGIKADSWADLPEDLKAYTECGPIDEETLGIAATKLEVIDRNGDFWGEEMGGPKRVLGRKKGFTPYDAKVAFAGSGFESTRSAGGV